ncbi:RNA-dependent DNA polymerase [Pseudoscourfieldia marina]
MDPMAAEGLTDGMTHLKREKSRNSTTDAILNALDKKKYDGRKQYRRWFKAVVEQLEEVGFYNIERDIKLENLEEIDEETWAANDAYENEKKNGILLLHRLWKLHGAPNLANTISALTELLNIETTMHQDPAPNLQPERILTEFFPGTPDNMKIALLMRTVNTDKYRSILDSMKIPGMVIPTYLELKQAVQNHYATDRAEHEQKMKGGKRKAQQEENRTPKPKISPHAALATAVAAEIDIKDVECFKCGQLGHYANKCPNPPKDGNPTSIPKKQVAFLTDKPEDRNDVHRRISNTDNAATNHVLYFIGGTSGADVQIETLMGNFRGNYTRLRSRSIRSKDYERESTSSGDNLHNHLTKSSSLVRLAANGGTSRSPDSSSTTTEETRTPSRSDYVCASRLAHFNETKIKASIAAGAKFGEHKTSPDTATKKLTHLCRGALKGKHTTSPNIVNRTNGPRRRRTRSHGHQDRCSDTIISRRQVLHSLHGRQDPSYRAVRIAEEERFCKRTSRDVAFMRARASKSKNCAPTAEKVPNEGEMKKIALANNIHTKTTPPYDKKAGGVHERIIDTRRMSWPYYSRTARAAQILPIVLKTVAIIYNNMTHGATDKIPSIELFRSRRRSLSLRIIGSLIYVYDTSADIAFSPSNSPRVPTTPSRASTTTPFPHGAPVEGGGGDGLDEVDKFIHDALNQAPPTEGGASPIEGGGEPDLGALGIHGHANRWSTTGCTSASRG